MNTKLVMEVNIYLVPFPAPWKGTLQVRGSEASASIASR